jgi:hypothetical protein
VQQGFMSDWQMDLLTVGRSRPLLQRLVRGVEPGAPSQI